MRICIFLLALAIIAAPSLAVPVNPDPDAGTAAVLMAHGHTFVLCSEGYCYVLEDHGDGTYSWAQDQAGQLPLPLADIADWTPERFLTFDGQLWDWVNEGVGWVQVDTWPCEQVISADHPGLGAVKDLFR